MRAPNAVVFASIALVLGCVSGNPAASDDSDASDEALTLFGFNLGGCTQNGQCTSKDPCVEGLCIESVCRFRPHPKRPDCCSPTTNATCNDGLICTIDKCDHPQQGGWVKCSHSSNPKVLPPPCCDPNVTMNTCDDNNVCTIDECIGYLCVHKPTAKCCFVDNQCNDSWACTVDVCTKAPADLANAKKNGIPATKVAGTCAHTTKKGCCNVDKDCDDGKVCTVDTCNKAQHACSHVPTKDPDCCETAADCDDKVAKTTDYCVNHKCTSGPWLGVVECLTDSDCDDGLPYTSGSCKANVCEHTPKPGYCWDDKHAVTACDDGNSCTIDYCVNNVCRHTGPKNGCCKTVADCWATCGEIAKCGNIDPTTKSGVCTIMPKPSVCNPLMPYICDDGNTCTADSCKDCDQCVHDPIPRCCLVANDCDDNNACTVDICAFNGCLNYKADPACCTVATQALDCGPGQLCKKQPNGAMMCGK